VGVQVGFPSWGQIRRVLTSLVGASCGVGVCEEHRRLNFLNRIWGISNFEPCFSSGNLHLMAPKHNQLKLPKALIDKLGGEGQIS
jgi:hypothetical protein